MPWKTTENINIKSKCQQQSKDGSDFSLRSVDTSVLRLMRPKFQSKFLLLLLRRLFLELSLNENDPFYTIF